MGDESNKLEKVRIIKKEGGKMMKGRSLSNPRTQRERGEVDDYINYGK
jgi:hypothetical protein